MRALLIFLAVTARADWPYYAGDAAGTRYSPLTQINRSNATRLRIAWTYHTGDARERPQTTIECTPIVVDGVMYVTSPQLKVIAFDAATGKERWTYDPWAGEDERSRGVNRGLTYWTDGKEKRILAALQTRLIAINAVTGEPIPSFGDNGRVNLAEGLDRDPPGSFTGVTTPGVIYKDLYITGSSVGEGPRLAAPGHVRAYNVRTGKREWIFHTIPHPGEFGHDTWEGDAWKTAGGANDWGGMSVDAGRGLVFLALGSPAFDFYGGQRRGANLFGNAVVALEAATGKRVWHFQTVHHDLWDYDLPTLPILARVSGRDVVVQVTKTGFVFVLDRVTGKPVFPVEERPVPASDMPGEKTFAAQPFPSKPPALVAQTFEPTNISAAARAYVVEQLKSARAGSIFLPPSRQGTVILPGFHGGALWGGAAVDPGTGRLFVPTNNVPWILTLVEARSGAAYPYDHTGYKRFLDEEGYPAVKPPWGVLNAVDLAKGEIAWKAVAGEYPELTARGVAPTGTELIGGAIATAGGLVFLGATHDEKFRAFDSASGKILWETKLEAGGYATPATYQVNGKQYVVIAAGGGGKLATRPGDAFVAFALP